MSKKSKTTDPAAFEGEGIRFRAKIIGIEMVPESRGDKMCQEMLQKLKGDVKSTARHKQKVFINITLEGIKIIDGVSLSVLYIHEVTRISFISRDQSDTRAFAYIVGSGDSATPSHTLYAIKTANAAEALVLCLKDLFQTVYEIKKKAIEDAKAKQEAGENEVKPAENGKEGENGGDNQESIYQVPKNNAPVNPQEQEEAVANLLDLEDQVDHILKGIEQIKNLDFENLPSEDAPRAPATSSAAPATIAPPPSSAASSSIADLSDPWGDPSPASVSSAPTSSLADLQALVAGTSTSNPFGMSSFASTAAPNVSMAGSGFGQMGMPFGVPSSQAAPGFGQMGMPFGVPSSQPSGGMPVTQNPFGNSPFAPQQQRPQMPGQSPFGQQPAFGAPFPGGPALAGQPFPGAMGVAPGMQPGFGMVGAPMRGPQPFGMVGAMGMSQGPAPGGVGQGNFFPQQQPEENLLQPLRPGGKEPEPEQTPKKPTQNAMFGDLLDIKKAAPADTSKSPKDLFKDLQQKDKKSLNEIKKEPTVKASVLFDEDPFKEDPFGSLDTMLKNIELSDSDPFHASPSSSPPSSSPPPPPSSSPPPPPSSSPPPLPSSSPPPPLSSPPPPPSSSPHHLPPSIPPQPPAPPYLPDTDAISSHTSNVPSLSKATTAPSAPSTSTRPDLTLSAPSSKESSPESRFDMPNEPPPPLPSHVISKLAAPSPPPRPPPIPNRPKPRSPASTASPIMSSTAVSATPPPIPSSSRPCSAVSGADPFSGSKSASDPFSGSGWDSSWSLPNRGSPFSPPSPSPSSGWSDSSEALSLSHSSSPIQNANFSANLNVKVCTSERSSDRAPVVPTNSDDPFGVPLRSKKSFSSADSSRRSSRSSGKLSSKSDTKSVARSDSSSKFKCDTSTDKSICELPSVTLDPFGMPWPGERTSSDAVSLKKENNNRSSPFNGGTDSPFDNAFSDSDSKVKSSPGKWEAFVDHPPSNGVKELKKAAAINSVNDRANSSPFGDPFA